MRRKKMLVICPYPKNVAPSQRLRFEQYYPYLNEQGFEIDVRSFVSRDFWNVIYSKGNILKKVAYTVLGYLNRVKTLFEIRKYEIVYVHLWVTPFGLPFFEFLTKLLSRRLIYDIDDLIYNAKASKANPAISSFKGRTKPIYLFKKADHIITSTSTIEEFAKQYSNKVSNIPVSVDTDKYTEKTNYKTNGKLVLGWTGSLSTSPYMHLLDEVLLDLKRELNFKLIVFGDPGFAIEGLDVESIPWSEEKEVATIKGFDIGLYPLPDEPWVYGKGGGKALQYMALGVPAVASAIGTNFKIIQNGENGFLVNSKEEWVSVIKQLFYSQELREKIGRGGTVTVKNIYSVTANKGAYLRILESLISN
jgi:L-malate glycosyltransferase